MNRCQTSPTFPSKLHSCRRRRENEHTVTTKGTNRMFNSIVKSSAFATALLGVAVLTISTTALSAETTSFQNGTANSGWIVTNQATVPEWKTTAPLKSPTEVTFRVHVPVGGSVIARAVTENHSAKPLLQLDFTLSQPDNAMIVASCDGAPMTVQMRDRWLSGGIAEHSEDTGMGKWSGSIAYHWRFAGVKNLWDEGDRHDIGAAYANLVPFTEKDFYLRLVLENGVRQIWMDDRLVSEEHVANSDTASFVVQTSNGAKALSAETDTPLENDSFIPFSLVHYSHSRKALAAQDTSKPLDLKSSDGRTITMLAPLKTGTDIDLGESLYRYRMTKDAGPDAPYAGSIWSWPDPFTIDPASLTFRAPFREYQNAWLLAWMDDEANKVPRGTFRFYHDDAGYCASTDFEISKDAIARKLVTKLSERTADGKTLYLLRVPIDRNAFYGFRDPMQRVVSFELSKPVALSRSYPDPIFTRLHHAGL